MKRGKLDTEDLVQLVRKVGVWIFCVLYACSLQIPAMTQALVQPLLDGLMAAQQYLSSFSCVLS